MLYHDKKGHNVKDADDYNDSTKTQIESLQTRSKSKITAIKDHVTCINTQKKRITDHIAGKEAEINKIYQASLNKLNEGKAALDKQLDAQKVKFSKRLDEMKDADERLITSIESASVLAGNSMKAPLEGDIIVIRDTLSGELNNVLGRDDPENKMATDVADRAEQLISTPKCDQLNFGQLQKTDFGIGRVGFLVCLIVVACILFIPNNDPEKKCGTELADRAEQLIFTPNNQPDQLNIGEVLFMKCVSVCNVVLSKKGSMNGMAATHDGKMAVGLGTGGIDIFSADGQLQETVLKDVGIRDVGYLSDGRYVVGTINHDVIMYTDGSEKLDVSFDNNKDLNSRFTVDGNDLIYVGYWKARKIQVFSPAGGKAIREIPYGGYELRQITSYNDLLIIVYGRTVRIIGKDGNVKHKVVNSTTSAYVAVTQNNSILIAWVKHYDGLVSIDEYTSELKHVQTLISDHKIVKPEDNWYYLREFRSGEIAFCTPDRLYIFKITIAPCSP